MTPLGIMGIHRIVFTFVLLITLILHNTVTGTRGILLQPLYQNEEGSEMSSSFPTSSHSNSKTEVRVDGSDPMGNQKKESELINLNVDSSDAVLPSELNYFQDNGISPESRKHLLSKRQIRNDYERFYLCLFTLFTNPQCQNQQQQQVDNINLNNQPQTNIDGGIFAFDSNPNMNSPYVPVQQQTAPARQGFFGLGLGQGLFGNRFQNNDNYNVNNFQQPLPIQPQLGGEFFQIVQSPYPEPPINRRPGGQGPENLQQNNIAQQTTTTTSKPLTTNTVDNTSSSEVTEQTTTSPTVSSIQFIQPTDLLASSCQGGTCNTFPESPKVSVVPMPTNRPPHFALPPKNIDQADEDPFILFEEKFSKLNKLEEENRVLKSESTSAQKQLETYLVQTKYLQEALANSQEETTKLKQRTSQLERTNDHLQKQNGQLQHLTGDQKTQINQFTNKIKYLEDKVLRLSGQNFPLTREVERHQQAERTLEDKIRLLTKENSECRNQIYQIQLRQTQRQGQDYVKSQKGGGEEETSQRFRGDITFGNSTEDFSDDTTTINSSGETTINPEAFITSAEITSNTEFTTGNFDTTTTVKPNFSVIKSTTELPPLTSVPSVPTVSTLPEEIIAVSSTTTSSPLIPNIIFDDTPGDEYAISDRNIFGVGFNLPNVNTNANINTNSDINLNNNLNGNGYNYPYGQNQYNNVWSLPLFPALFDRSQNNGYGQNQGYYRNL